MEFDEIEKTVMLEMHRIYSKKAIEHAINPRNVGRIEKADGITRITGSCGDTMETSLKIENDEIINAKFWTDGCGASIACGSITTDLVRSQKVFEAKKSPLRKFLRLSTGFLNQTSIAQC